MTTTTNIKVICDDCKLEIDKSETYINATTYGIDLHVLCFKSLTPFKLCKILGLDDIRYMKIDDWDNAQKLIYVTGGFQ